MNAKIQQILAEMAALIDFILINLADGNYGVKSQFGHQILLKLLCFIISSFEFELAISLVYLGKL